MPELYHQSAQKKLIVTVVAVVVIASTVLLVDALRGSNDRAVVTTSLSSQTSTPTTPSTTATATTSTSINSYKDGTYSASSSYSVPSGSESIKVSLTLSDGTITDASIVNTADDHDSAEYQADFANSYKSAVVGQKISGLSLSNIAGASDTTTGFNDALSQIATQAQA